LLRLAVAPPLELVPEALAEAEAAAEWYAARSPKAAAGFVAEVEAAIATILRIPAAWPAFDHGTRRYLLRRFPYSVVYRIDPDRILIVAVAHGHRRPGYWRTRLPG